MTRFEAHRLGVAIEHIGGARWATTTEYAYGSLDAPDIITPTGEDIDDLGSAQYNAEEFWQNVLQRTVIRGPWSVYQAPKDMTADERDGT